jgi:hypothetical protein
MPVSQSSGSTEQDGRVDEAMKTVETRRVRRSSLQPPAGAVNSALNEPETLLEGEALAKRNAALARLANARRQSAARAGNVSIA